MAELDDPSTGAGASALGPALSATSPSAVVTTFSSSPSSSLCTGSPPSSLAGCLASSFTSSLSSGSPETHTSGPQRNGKRSASAHGTVCSATRVCKRWNAAATKALYSDPGPAISRYEGLYLPRLIASLKRDEFLRESVRNLTITASLEAGLWVSSYKREGDLFCELVELCPRLRCEVGHLERYETAHLLTGSRCSRQLSLCPPSRRHVGHELWLLCRHAR